jgi:uncharacterized protein
MSNEAEPIVESPWPESRAEAVPPPPLEAQPVAESERVQAVDVLRGVALLGILVMNIPTFAWPGMMDSPLLNGSFQDLDRALWIIQHVVFETKMMTIFSMLFGAGLVLMSDRAATRGASLTGRYYRRVLWLMAFGAIHGYLIWAGDILFWYGACGLLLYPMRNWSPRVLIGLGLAMNLVIALIALPIGIGIFLLRQTATDDEANPQRPAASSGLEQELRTVWTKMQPKLEPSPENQTQERQKEIDIYQGNYVGILQHRVPLVLTMETFGLVFFGWWLCGGRMLIGMGLMKLGVFSASRTSRFYLGLLALGYGIGLPLVLGSTWFLIHDRFRIVSEILDIGVLNFLGGLAMALGHVAVVMLLFQAGVVGRLQRALAAVGRMALTNYLTHSLVLSTLFYGYGLGYYNQVNRATQMGIVLAIWVFQLIASPIWLSYFRYGPAEWLWRSLTYGEAQPMRHEPVT